MLNQISDTILAQLGGIRKLMAMIGAHNFVIEEKGLQFTFKGCKKANICRILLSPSDTYRFELYRFKKSEMKLKEIEIIEDVYNDQLINVFQESTGLFLSL